MYLTQPLHRNLQCCPERQMTIFGERSMTVREFVGRVACLAGALRQLRVTRGDRVAMLGLNSDRYMEYLYAVPWADAVLNPCNTRWSVRENAYALEDSATSLLLVDDTFLPMAVELQREVKSLRQVIHVGELDTPPGMLNYQELMDGAKPVEDARRGGPDLLGLFYTGGTTGFPKGVMISHQAFWISQISLVGAGCVPPQSRIIRAAPMFHMADLAIGYLGVLQNSTHVILPAFHPLDVLASIEQQRIEVALLVPTMIQMLVNHPQVRSHDLSALHTLAYGASPIQEQVLRDLQALRPGIRLFQVYGQTEMAPAVTILGPEQHTPEAAARGLLRSCGRPTLGVEVKIVDAAGNEVPRGSVGEVATRGGNMMQGYWNKPEQTAAAIPADGWLRTGDGAWMDEDGFIYIVDRVKDMIVTGGENVYSCEVENALASHPDVAMCAVIGIPSEEWGETVHAVIVAKPGKAPSQEALIAHCKGLIAGYKCPKSTELRDALPISGAGKLLKNQLREPFWEGKSRRVG